MIFNLEQFKQGRDAITRDGRVAKFVYHYPNAQRHERLGVFSEGNVFFYPENGCLCGDRSSPSDLVAMAPKMRQLWVRAYRNDIGYIEIETGTSKDDAELSDSSAAHYVTEWLDTEPKFHGSYPEPENDIDLGRT